MSINSIVPYRALLNKLLYLLVSLLLVIALCVLAFETRASAIQYPKLVDKSLHISTSEPGANATYTISFRFPNTSLLGSLKFKLCADPYVLDPCSSTPAGNLSGGNLVSQSGISGFSIYSQVVDEIILSRTPGSSGTGQISFVFDDILNPTGIHDVFYIQMFTYGSADASGAPIYMSSVASATASPIVVTAKVPPILYFCAALTIDEWCQSSNGNFIDYGTLDPINGHSATSQFGVATNATGGYVVTVNGNTMTSGNKKISALASPDFFQTGTAQFGLNLRANTLPALGQDATGVGTGLVIADYDQPDLFKYKDGDPVAYATTGSVFNTYTVTYIVNLPPDQPSGVYNTTIAYICTAAF